MEQTRSVPAPRAQVSGEEASIGLIKDGMASSTVFDRGDCKRTVEQTCTKGVPVPMVEVLTEELSCRRNGAWRGCLNGTLGDRAF
jgi:hypothetical protein